jgi:hypothetical protein
MNLPLKDYISGQFDDEIYKQAYNTGEEEHGDAR